jgi:Sulfotransferase family
MTGSTDALAAARASGLKIPEFFIVGQPKSGTTALYEMLKSHPGIFMPELKETRFFDREWHPGMSPISPDLDTGEEPLANTIGRPPGDRHPNTVEEYLALFSDARADQRAGEASPGYLRSPRTATRIAQLEPDARIIAIFREPASFLRSAHLQLLQDHVETEKDFGRALAREERDHDAKPVLWYAMERIEYVKQLRRYHELFGHERVLVLIYDDFRADNEGTMRRVLRLLDVDDAAQVTYSEANQTVLVRSPRMYDLQRSLYLGRSPGGRVAKSAIKALTPQKLRHHGLRALRKRVIYGKPQPPDEALMLELRRRFKGEVAALGEYLDRDLISLWGYERI